MGREDKERKPKPNIDKEFPKWDWVDYKLQDAQFFKEVKKLSTKGLDPKHDVTNEQVTIVDITKVFSNVKVFKTTNPLLPPVTKEIKTLYQKINGFAHIINNELMLWFVKGWIVE